MERETYRGADKGLYVLLSRTQAEQLSKSRKKFLATTYKNVFASLYLDYVRVDAMHSFNSIISWRNEAGNVGLST